MNKAPGWSVPLGEILIYRTDRNNETKKCQKFALALNNFANCCLTQEDINLFTSRIIQKGSYDNLPIKSIHLFSTNASVNAHNETVLNALS